MPDDLAAEIGRGLAARFPLAAADLLARGVPRGPALGAALAALRRAWVEEDFRPDRDDLLARLPLSPAG
jgi:poly(A) polymerase